MTAARSLQTLAQELRASKKALLGLLSQSQASAAETFFSRTVEAAGESGQGRVKLVNEAFSKAMHRTGKSTLC